MKKLAAWLLKCFGWSVEITVPDYPKCIICVAPHTSNWDFVIGKLVYASVGRKAGFLMKDTWFFWPLGVFFRSMGGIAVPRKRKSTVSLTDLIVEKFNASERLVLAITPEGTRSRTTRWHTGFLHIAIQSSVPIVLGVIDFKTKNVFIKDTFVPSGDIEKDIRTIKDYYKPYQGKYPENFSTE